MTALHISILAVWVVFWAYWLISAAGAKSGSRRPRTRALAALIVVLGVAVARVFKGDNLAVHSPFLQALGVIVLLSGLGLAVWARVNLGRNWGMPMTKKDDPELVTSGPYRVVRHPIYSGILLGVLGTSLATDIYGLIVLAVIAAYFVYSATVEERLMSSSFPDAYASYKAHTKMLIPYVL